MAPFTAQVFPGQALGFLALGASLHEIITRIKAEPQVFPKLDLVYDEDSPVKQPILLGLPVNGLRLRFDGPEQRLRLIEVQDFTRSRLLYGDQEIFKSISTQGSLDVKVNGPTFRHIYHRLLPPTYAGEFIAPADEDKTKTGLYILSCPGIAFSFPLQTSAWSPKKDFVSLLSSSASGLAVSMAVFSGPSWPAARKGLFTERLPPLRAFPAFTKSRDPVPDEVSLVKICGEGLIEVVQSSHLEKLQIQLGKATPQTLVAAFGPPDAIYQKNDQRMSIHQNRATSTRSHSAASDRLADDSTDTDVSSSHTTTDDSNDDLEGETAKLIRGEYFYNYFYRGFDILMSSPKRPSQRPPLKRDEDNMCHDIAWGETPPRLVATKLVLHGNIPGSYPFNRHRRCQWQITYLDAPNQEPVTSETPFNYVASRLQETWKGIYKDAEEAKSQQRGMVLNRDWGDSPGSSIELLGGWEESAGRNRNNNASNDDNSLGNTSLFGFPGLVFEVLKNEAVSSLTVF